MVGRRGRAGSGGGPEGRGERRRAGSPVCKTRRDLGWGSLAWRSVLAAVCDLRPLAIGEEAGGGRVDERQPQGYCPTRQIQLVRGVVPSRRELMDERGALFGNVQLDESARIQIERHRRSSITASATEAPLSRAARNDPVGFPPSQWAVPSRSIASIR